MGTTLNVTQRDTGGNVSEPAKAQVSIVGQDGKAQAQITPAELGEPQESVETLDDGSVNILLGLLGITLGSTSLSRSFSIEEGVGEVSFSLKGTQLADVGLLGAQPKLNISLLKQGSNGQFEVVDSTVDGSSQLLSIALLSQNRAEASFEGLEPGNYQLAISYRPGAVGALQRIEVSDINVKTVSIPDAGDPTTGAAQGNLLLDSKGELMAIDPDATDIFVSQGGSWVQVDGETSIAGQFGTFLVQSDGSYRYEPDANVDNIGQRDSLSYRLEDANGRSEIISLQVELKDAAPSINEMAARQMFSFDDLSDSFDLMEADTEHNELKESQYSSTFDAGEDETLSLSSADDVLIDESGDAFDKAEMEGVGTMATDLHMDVGSVLAVHQDELANDAMSHMVHG
ncbi:Ig-like domain-containing protein [Halomonas sp. Y3]|uniref:Ig-like domain-containing protein n=1 Tax=Halomonas sp. Y3 TaxID=2956797 RepID=UPI0020A13EDC|nr:Ig-like domain-containing protein [Halomonas sp. Y3]